MRGGREREGEAGSEGEGRGGMVLKWYPGWESIRKLSVVVG